MYELVSFVTRSNLRIRILEILRKPMTPSQIASAVTKHRSTISRSLITLEKKGIITCLTPQEHHERYYVISDIGLKVLKEILELKR